MHGEGNKRHLPRGYGVVSGSNVKPDRSSPGSTTPPRHTPSITPQSSLSQGAPTRAATTTLTSFNANRSNNRNPAPTAAPYTYSVLPTAVCNRSSSGLSAVIPAAAAASATASPLEKQQLPASVSDNRKRPPAPAKLNTISTAATTSSDPSPYTKPQLLTPYGSRGDAERQRVRDILGLGTGADPAVVSEPVSEQDTRCELAAAGIIVAAQAGGVCDVAMRGITRLAPSILKFFRVEGAVVTELQVQGNRLTELPPVELLPSLTRLDASANMLEQVSPGLCRLRRLHTLDLSRNEHLHRLPEEVCELTGLTSLDLSHNALECLPLRMERLVRLVEMRLDCNQLSYLPPALAGLPSLTALHVSHNLLTALPSELGVASSLTGLFAGHNKLTALPGSIGQLRQRLSELQLHDNELTVLPRELGQLAALTRITSSGNPLVHPPREVAMKGVAVVREYLLGGWMGRSEGEGKEGEREEGEGEEGEGEEEGDGEGCSSRRSAKELRRLALGSTCKACADKTEEIEELGQLLRDARDRLDRAERQLAQSREQLGRQARDLTNQTVRLVEAEAERNRLSRQLEAVPLQPRHHHRGQQQQQAAAVVGEGGETKARGAAGGGAVTSARRRGGEMEAHLQGEVRELRQAAEVAQAAATTAERNAAGLRRDLEAREAQFAAERERATELAAAVQRERERCVAATAVATEAERRLKQLQSVLEERDDLAKKLQMAQESAAKASAEAWRAAHVAREGHLSSEAAADMVSGRLAAAEAANNRLEEQLKQQRATASAAALDAESRERQLQLEIEALRAQLSTLLAEREILQGVMAIPAEMQPPLPARPSVASTWGPPQRI